MLPASPARQTAYGLLALRVSLFLLMIVWALLKITTPQSYAGEGIFSNYYGVSLGTAPVLAMGALQIAFLLAFVAGVARTITSGGVLLMNAVSLVVSLPTILPTFVGGGNPLFAASFTVLGASLALFLMREQDTFLSVSARQPAAPAVA